MIFLWKVLVALICSAIILLVLHVKKRMSHPPGPLGFPLVGLLPLKIIQIFFSKYLPKFSEREFYKQMKDKYGDIWSVEMGSQRLVIFASMETLTEALVNNANLFSARPTNELLREFFENEGIMFANGEVWKDNKQMAIRALREFGMGKVGLVNQICDEGNELIKYLTSISTKPVDTSISFVKAASNVISHLVFNEANNYDDPEFETYVKHLNSVCQNKAMVDVCFILPQLATSKLGRFLFSNLDNYLTSWDIVRAFIRNKCKRKLKSATANESPESVFDYFWKYRYQHDKNLDDEEKLFGIFYAINDLYNAGSETTNSLIIFCCLMLGRYQDVQDDLRREVRNLTDEYSKINMDMIKDCPKLHSFIGEVHRYCNIVPRYFHGVTEPCIFKEYKLYPSDFIFGDIGTISRDSNIFQDPDLFNPYRFMNKSKTKYIPNKSLSPFGIGKRVCIGESIANVEIFLFLSRIIHNFHISLPKEILDKFDDIVEGEIGITHEALHHEIHFNLVEAM